MSAYDVLTDCENEPSGEPFGTVISPTGCRAYLPASLHGVVMRELLPFYRRTW